MDTNKLQLPKDFFKQFKNKEEFKDFFQSLFKDGVEAMLQAELDEHLGYEKHSREGDNSGDSRNGSSQKTVKGESLGDMLETASRVQRFWQLGMQQISATMMQQEWQQQCSNKQYSQGQN